MRITKRTIIGSVLILILLIAVITGYTFLLQRGKKIERDMQRISDMKNIQAAYERNFADHYTYKNTAEGCGEIGSLVQQCSNLEVYMPQIQLLKDPGELHYLVKTVATDSEYAISFTLEYGNKILGPGEHLVTHNGIQ